MVKSGKGGGEGKLAELRLILQIWGILITLGGGQKSLNSEFSQIKGFFYLIFEKTKINTIKMIAFCQITNRIIYI